MKEPAFICRNIYVKTNNEVEFIAKTDFSMNFSVQIIPGLPFAFLIY